MNLLMVIALALVAAAADSGMFRSGRDEASGENTSREAGRLAFFTSFYAPQGGLLLTHDGGRDHGFASLPLPLTPWNGEAGAPRRAGTGETFSFWGTPAPVRAVRMAGVNAGRAPPTA